MRQIASRLPKSQADCPWPHRQATAEEKAEMKKNEENAKAQSQSPKGPTNKPCAQWAKGSCTYGDACRFVHDEVAKRKGAPGKGAGGK